MQDGVWDISSAIAHPMGVKSQKERPSRPPNQTVNGAEARGRTAIGKGPTPQNGDRLRNCKGKTNPKIRSVSIVFALLDIFLLADQRFIPEFGNFFIKNQIVRRKGRRQDIVPASTLTG